MCVCGGGCLTNRQPPEELRQAGRAWLGTKGPGVTLSSASLSTSGFDLERERHRNAFILIFTTVQNKDDIGLKIPQKVKQHCLFWGKFSRNTDTLEGDRANKSTF